MLHILPDRPWGPPALLYNGFQASTGGKVAGEWRSPPTPHLAPRLKKEWSNTSNPPVWALWPVIGLTLPLPSRLTFWRRNYFF